MLLLRQGAIQSAVSRLVSEGLENLTLEVSELHMQRWLAAGQQLQWPMCMVTWRAMARRLWHAVFELMSAQKCTKHE